MEDIPSWRRDYLPQSNHFFFPNPYSYHSSRFFYSPPLYPSETDCIDTKITRILFPPLATMNTFSPNNTNIPEQPTTTIASTILYSPHSMANEIDPQHPAPDQPMILDNE